MSGAEVVLGILPLLIAAAEHWNGCLQTFKRYRKFATEVDLFQERLKIQKTVFRNQCRILLENATQDDSAGQMLGEPSHLSSPNPIIECQLAEYLAESKDACQIITRLIRERLEDVHTESEELGIVVAHDRDVGTFPDGTRKARERESAYHRCDTQKIPLGDKTWRRHLATKLRFSFSKTRLDENLKALCSLNDDFRSLNDDLRTLSGKPAAAQLTLPKTPRCTHKEIQVCQSIGKASRQVYEALGKACTKHTEHLAHFNLKVEHEPSQGTIIPEMKFKMAFTHLTLTGLSQGDPVWFVVDSITEGSEKTELLKAIPKIDHLTASLKRQSAYAHDCSRMPSKKQVQSQTSTRLPTASVSSMRVPSALLSVPSIRRDFCDYLRKYVSQQHCNPGTCMALLEATGGCKHVVYPSPYTSTRTKKQAVTLQQYISSLSKKNEPAGIPRYERLRLAKDLATAVLQYHGTPWLKLTWRSEDVIFFEEFEGTSKNEVLDLTVPHLNVKVKGPDAEDPQAACILHNIAPNSILFGLGVVLLEIAYSATLQSLQQPSDLCNGSDNSISEFFTAKRLARSLGREMGMSYSKIVKKLIQCDFGCGDDLNEPDLQAGYYRDVVCELDRLEQTFRELQL